VSAPSHELTLHGFGGERSNAAEAVVAAYLTFNSA
jgi:hypothetical protein